MDYWNLTLVSYMDLPVAVKATECHPPLVHFLHPALTKAGPLGATGESVQRGFWLTRRKPCEPKERGKERGMIKAS